LVSRSVILNPLIFGKWIIRYVSNFLPSVQKIMFLLVLAFTFKAFLEKNLGALDVGRRIRLVTH
jgi:hypothetical protein